MGPEMAFLTPQKLFVSENHTFSQKSAFSRFVANFLKKSEKTGSGRKSCPEC
jgi:hypothetical protein